MTALAGRVRDAAGLLGLPPRLADRVAGHARRSRLAAGPVLVACDLDRTLIYSSSALDLPASDGRAPELAVAEIDRGVPISFLTRDAARMLAVLGGLAPVVPATTRTDAQYARVRLGCGRSGYAVTCNGGRILVDGRPDDGWTARVASRLRRDCAPVAEVAGELRQVGAPGALERLHVVEDLFCYAVVDRAALGPEMVDRLRSWCARRAWTVSVQGRKLYCVPLPLTKSAAVAEVRRRVGGGHLVTAGDSTLDAELLATADVAVRPAHGELHEAGWRARHVAVTRQCGVLGGEEIVARLLAVVLSTTVPPENGPSG